MPCPLRSQIKQVKARMFSGIEGVQIGKESSKHNVQKLMQSFLNERAVQKLIPERDSEIDRITNLIAQLKRKQKEDKDKRDHQAYQRMKTKKRNEARHRSKFKSMDNSSIMMQEQEQEPVDHRLIHKSVNDSQNNNGDLESLETGSNIDGESLFNKQVGEAQSKHET